VAEFCATHDDVGYFPSYEMAINADPQAVFMGDKRHIRQEFVAHIVERFVSQS
jgi:hypothetical protein